MRYLKYLKDLCNKWDDELLLGLTFSLDEYVLVELLKQSGLKRDARIIIATDCKKHFHPGAARKEFPNCRIVQIDLGKKCIQHAKCWIRINGKQPTNGIITSANLRSFHLANESQDCLDSCKTFRMSSDAKLESQFLTAIIKAAKNPITRIKLKPTTIEFVKGINDSIELIRDNQSQIGSILREQIDRSELNDIYAYAPFAGGPALNQLRKNSPQKKIFFEMETRKHHRLHAKGIVINNYLYWGSFNLTNQALWTQKNTEILIWEKINGKALIQFLYKWLGFNYELPRDIKKIMAPETDEGFEEDEQAGFLQYSNGGNGPYHVELDVKYKNRWEVSIIPHDLDWGNISKIAFFHAGENEPVEELKITNKKQAIKLTDEKAEKLLANVIMYKDGKYWIGESSSNIIVKGLANSKTVWWCPLDIGDLYYRYMQFNDELTGRKRKKGQSFGPGGPSKLKLLDLRDLRKMFLNLNESLGNSKRKELAIQLFLIKPQGESGPEMKWIQSLVTEYKKVNK